MGEPRTGRGGTMIELPGAMECGYMWITPIVIHIYSP